MLLLADFFDFKYWMLKEKSPREHIVYIQHAVTKRHAQICLESLEILESNLSDSQLREALSVLRDFKEEFMQYWLSETRA